MPRKLSLEGLLGYSFFSPFLPSFSLIPLLERKKEERKMENKTARRGASLGLAGIKCPECGRRFYPTPIYGWRIGDKKYCRYSCMRKEEKRREEKRKKKEEAKKKK